MATADLLEFYYDLLAAVFKRALLDARKGDRKAVKFLDTSLPDWRIRDAKRGKAIIQGKGKSRTEVRLLFKARISVTK